MSFPVMKLHELYIGINVYVDTCMNVVLQARRRSWMLQFTGL